MDRHDRKLARAVYAMVLLAVFAMVWPSGEFVYLAIICLAAMISWPIAHGRNRPSPVPRWLISTAVLSAMAFFLLELASLPAVTALMHFMIFVQVCKFFESKRARDYGQLIVLSMLQIVVAAILSSSLGFAVMLVAYLALCIYTLLLFHFKREMELFAAAGASANGKRRRGGLVPPAPGAVANASGTLGRIADSRFWRISATTGTFVLVVGVLLFASFPRVGEGLLGQWQALAGGHVTGFNPRPELGDIGTIKESDELAMRVAVWENGQRTRLAKPLLLRGATQDRYVAGRWQSSLNPAPPRPYYVHAGDPPTFLTDRWPTDPAVREFQVELEGMDASYLFSPYPPLAIRTDRAMTVTLYRHDLTLHARFSGRETSGFAEQTRYTVLCPRDPASADMQLSLDDRPAPDQLQPGNETPIMPKLRDLAREWTAGLNNPADWPEAIERQLQARCQYSLAMPPPDGHDPLESFLFKSHRGHCEYFASAMTVLCQQLGLSARLVNGYKGVEYNGRGDYYMIRQKHAHSWAEVALPGRGWVSFDPTPSAGDDSFQTPTGLLAWFGHTFDYLDYRWQTTVVNYSGSDREQLFSRTEGGVASSLRVMRGWAAAVGDFVRELFTSPAHALSGRGGPVVVLLIALALLAGLLAVRSRRRAARPQRERLLRRSGLGFWADLLALLDRHGFAPSPAMTPLELARDLAGRLAPAPRGLPALALSYYKVRYGQAKLDRREQNAVQETLASLATALRDRSTRTEKA